MDKEWYEIRDLLFGQNYRKQDIAKAIVLAKQCAHPDAVLICNVLQKTNHLVMIRDALIKELLEYEGQHNDGRALCFAWCLLENNNARHANMNWIIRASAAGFAFAQTQQFKISYYTAPNAVLRPLAEKAISKNERDGYWCLMRLYDGKHDSLEAAKKGAKLGSVDCMTFVGRKSKNLKEAITFLGQAAVFGEIYYFKHLFEELPIWSEMTNDTQLIYLAGYYAKNTFLLPRLENILFFRASHAINYYTGQNTACRAAVDTWSLCALRLKLYKDIRILIAKIVWDSRLEALFDIPQ